LDRDNRTAQAREREAFARRKQRKLVSYAEAVKRRFRIPWEEAALPKPAFLGRKVLRDVPLPQIVPYIDWSPFFMAWELSGKYPHILSDARVGAEARKLFGDADVLLGRIVKEKLLTAHAVYGVWPANSDGDDIVLFTDESRRQELCRFVMLRQQWEREGQESFRSLADYVAPVETGKHDYLGAFAVTAGVGCAELVQRFKAEQDDYNAIMAE